MYSHVDLGGQLLSNVDGVAGHKEHAPVRIRLEPIDLFDYVVSAVLDGVDSLDFDEILRDLQVRSVVQVNADPPEVAVTTIEIRKLLNCWKTLESE